MRPAMNDTLHWLDVEEIAEELDTAHPQIDPMRLGFPKLRMLVEALPNFAERPGHPCNERILETIQANWIELRGDAPSDDDDDEA